MDYPYYCRHCHSPRPETTCWKCGAETIVPRPEWKNTRLPPVGKIRELAREMGYALAVHGSLQRDLDIVAVPWIPEAAPAARLIEHICQGLPCQQIDITENKPHGRVAVNLIMDGWWKMIDLSIMPLQVELIPATKLPGQLTTRLRERLAIKFYNYQPRFDATTTTGRLHASRAMDRLRVPRLRDDLNEDQLAFLLSTL